MIARAPLVLIAAVSLIATASCKDNSCRKRLDVMQARLSKAVAWDTGGAAVDVELVEHPAATPRRDERTLAIGVTHDGLVINGHALPASVDDVQLGQVIALEREALRLTSEGAPLVVELWTDRRAPIALLRRVAERFELDTELRLIARLPGALDIEPPPERVARAVETLEHGDAATRATRAAEATTNAVGTCAEVVRVFGQMAAMPPRQKVETLRDKLVPAIAPCGCETVDVPMLEELLLRLLEAREPRRGWITLDRVKLLDAANVAQLFGS